jgi:hypothetical protein
LSILILHIQSCSTDFIEMLLLKIKERRMRWAGHVARMGELKGAYNILDGRPEGRNH